MIDPDSLRWKGNSWQYDEEYQRPQIEDLYASLPDVSKIQKNNYRCGRQGGYLIITAATQDPEHDPR